MKADLSGNVAVVTGAGRGLGRAVAVALARQGTKVVLVARSRDELAATAATIGSELGETLVVPTDVSAYSVRSAAAMVLVTVSQSE